MTITNSTITTFDLYSTIPDYSRVTPGKVTFPKIPILSHNKAFKDIYTIDITMTICTMDFP